LGHPPGFVEPKPGANFEFFMNLGDADLPLPTGHPRCIPKLWQKHRFENSTRQLLDPSAALRQVTDPHLAGEITPLTLMP
jgi:hypothetical protein